MSQGMLGPEGSPYEYMLAEAFSILLVVEQIERASYRSSIEESLHLSLMSSLRSEFKRVASRLTEHHEKTKGDLFEWSKFIAKYKVPICV